MENQASKSILSSIRAVFVEIIIIVVLSGIALFILNYFKIINLNTLISNNDLSKNTQVKNEVNENSYQKPTETSNNYLNYAQKQLGVITKNKALHYALLAVEYEGKIISIDTTSGFDKKTGTPYAVSLNVALGNSGDTIQTLYPQEIMNKVELYDKSKKKISLSDFKVGDSVIINTVTNIFLKYPNNFISLTITKK